LEKERELNKTGGRMEFSLKAWLVIFSFYISFFLCLLLINNQIPIPTKAKTKPPTIQGVQLKVSFALSVLV
jgi:hypothetical protein